MRMLRFDESVARPIGPGLRGTGLARDDTSNVIVLYLEPGGEIPSHPAAVDQILLVVAGTGRVCGDDGRWRPIGVGQAAVWSAGEQHTTRAETALTLAVIEQPQLLVHPRAVPLPDADADVSGTVGGSEGE